MIDTSRIILICSEFKDSESIIRDPVWSDVVLSSRAKKIIDLDIFQELRNITQVYHKQLVYPGVSYSIFSHSLGVYSLAKEVIMRMAKRDVDRYPFSLGIEALTFVPSKKDHPEIEENTVEAVQKELITRSLDIFFCAALLHDVGKYPFARVLRELKREFERELKEDAKTKLSKIVSGRRRSADLLLRVNKDDEYTPLYNTLLHNWKLRHIHIQRLANIIGDSTIHEEAYANRKNDVVSKLYFEHDLVFRKILYGPIGINELDYLQRDCYYTRKQSSLDVYRLLDNLIYRLPYGYFLAENGRRERKRTSLTGMEGTHQDDDPQSKEIVTGVLSRGRFELETLFGLRNLLYKQLYWYPPIRVLDVMIKILLKAVLEKNNYDMEMVERQYQISDDDIEVIRRILEKYEFEFGPTSKIRWERGLVNQRILNACEIELVNKCNVTNERLLDFVHSEIKKIEPAPGGHTILPPLRALLLALRNWEVYEEIAFCSDIDLAKGKTVREIGEYISLEILRRIKNEDPKYQVNDNLLKWNEFTIIIDVKQLTFDEQDYIKSTGELVVVFPSKKSDEDLGVNYEPFFLISPFSNDALKDLESERKVLRFHCHSHFSRNEALVGLISKTLVNLLEESHNSARNEFLINTVDVPLVVRVR